MSGQEKKKRIPRAVLWGLVVVALVGAFGLGTVVRPRHVIKVLVAVKKRVKGVYARISVTERCASGPGALKTCVASDMARLPNHGPVPHEEWIFDGKKTITLHAARNEVVAFQVVLKGQGISPAVKASVKVSDLSGPGSARISAGAHLHRYLANYVWVEPGGYTWGARSEVLPWPDFYPDALVPFQTRCLLTTGGKLSSPRTVVDSFPVPPTDGANQAVWLDLYVPRAQTPGDYTGTVSVSAGGETLALDLNQSRNLLQ